MKKKISYLFMLIFTVSTYSQEISNNFFNEFKDLSFPFILDELTVDINNDKKFDYNKYQNFFLFKDKRIAFGYKESGDSKMIPFGKYKLDNKTFTVVLLKLKQDYSFVVFAYDKNNDLISYEFVAYKNENKKMVTIFSNEKLYSVFKNGVKENYLFNSSISIGFPYRLIVDKAITYEDSDFEIDSMFEGFTKDDFLKPKASITKRLLKYNFDATFYKKKLDLLELENITKDTLSILTISIGKQEFKTYKGYFIDAFLLQDGTTFLIYLNDCAFENHDFVYEIGYRILRNDKIIKTEQIGLFYKEKNSKIESLLHCNLAVKNKELIISYGQIGYDKKTEKFKLN